MVKQNGISPKSAHTTTFKAVAGLICSFLLAVGLDAIYFILREEARSTFHVLPSYLFAAVTPILLAVIMLALAWLQFVKLEPSRISGAIFLASGLTVLAIFFSQFIPFPVQLRRTIIGQIRYPFLSFDTRSSLLHLASFWAVAGLVQILSRRSHDR